MNTIDEIKKLEGDLAQIIQFALLDKKEDVRIFVARLVRKYRSSNPDLSGQMDTLLRSKQFVNSAQSFRKDLSFSTLDLTAPIDNDSKLSLLKIFQSEYPIDKPLLSMATETLFSQLLNERSQIEKLTLKGLSPTKSAVFVGPPGVGKTLSARWLASKLGVPLFVLDLSAIMSSLLGRSGANLRSALDYAKKTPCVLLLDEIDAIAKSRSDESDIGELKRLVTVILQEVDEWPETSLLIGATNHAELIDRALWRRFDLVINFNTPEKKQTTEAITLFLGSDYELFADWIEVLTCLLDGESFSDIKREIQRFRRAIALDIGSKFDLIKDYTKFKCLNLDKSKRIEMAVLIANNTEISQHLISDITGVSRDTIRKYTVKK